MALIFQNRFKGKLKVIVIDNNSTDGSALMIEKGFKDVLLIKNKENLGFAKAINQGIKKSKGNFVLLFLDGFRNVYQIDDCTKDQLKTILEDLKSKGIIVQE